MYDKLIDLSRYSDTHFPRVSGFKGPISKGIWKGGEGEGREGGEG